MAVGTLAPQTVSAYKYYIHTGNGNVITVKADNSNTAIDLFNLLIERGVLDAEKAYLTKRPNGVVLLAVKIANSIKGCGIGHTAS